MADPRRRSPGRCRDDGELGRLFGDRSTSNGAGSGYLALTAGSFGGVTATGQVARGFREPTLSDRYYRGPTGRGFITGNPDLEPETSLQYDIALRYTASRFRVAGYGEDMPAAANDTAANKARNRRVEIAMRAK